jgi:hypothetical protein
MAVEILNYGTSPLNPLLKQLVPLVFVVGTYYFYRGTRTYGGEVKNMTNLLFVAGVFGILATGFRYAGDKLVSWKWGESTFFLAFALVNVYVAGTVAHRLAEAVKGAE